MTQTSNPIAKVQLLIRKPIEQVFEAFIDPAITSKFWFTHGSGRMEVGKTLRWEWAMYGASTEVLVKAIEPNRRILVEWGGYGAMQPIEWVFSAKPDGTLVQISNWGFVSGESDISAQAIESTEGFSLVLAGLKAWLEYGTALNLIADHNPDAVTRGTQASSVTPRQAKGPFEVDLAPQSMSEVAAPAKLGRLSIDKQFHGDLEATSRGEMLSAMGNVEGSAGYVALERVTGSLHGRGGSFVLQHNGTLERGQGKLSVHIVPDSGTEQLTGISGQMQILIENGNHDYVLEYVLPL